MIEQVEHGIYRIQNDEANKPWLDSCLMATFPAPFPLGDRHRPGDGIPWHLPGKSQQRRSLRRWPSCDSWQLDLARFCPENLVAPHVRAEPPRYDLRGAGARRGCRTASRRRSPSALTDSRRGSRELHQEHREVRRSPASRNFQPICPKFAFFTAVRRAIRPSSPR